MVEAESIIEKTAAFFDVKPFAKKLAHTEKSIRDKSFAILRKWVESRVELVQIDVEELPDQTPEERVDMIFSESEAMKLWKALFYCVWMSDKVPVQQELVQNMALLLEFFSDFKNEAVQFLYNRFILCFFLTMQREWLGIDRLRIDKYYSLLRKMYYQILKRLFLSNFQESILNDYYNLIINVILCNKPDGIRFHIVSIFLDEIERVNETEDVTSTHFQVLLVPFYKTLLGDKSETLFTAIIKSIFLNLINVKEQELIPYALIKKSLFNIAADGKTEALAEVRRNDIYEIYEMLDTISDDEKFEDLSAKMKECVFEPNSQFKSAISSETPVKKRIKSKQNSNSENNKRVKFDKKLDVRNIKAVSKIKVQLNIGSKKGNGSKLRVRLTTSEDSKQDKKHEISIKKLKKNLLKAKRNTLKNQIRFTGTTKLKRK